MLWRGAGTVTNLSSMADQPTRAGSLAGNWDVLDAELEAWHASGRVATVWWRDDDAKAPGPRLNRLLVRASQVGVPVALAVIPALAEPALASVLDAHAGVSVLQHGYAHTNHAPRGQGLGAWELGLHRPRGEVLEDLEVGFARLTAIAGDQFVHAIAAPWNRIDPALFADLPPLGFTGVSAFGPRDSAVPVAGLKVNNAHCDPINWKRDASFTGESKAIGKFVDHLAARRAGTVDADEATGLLTHHMDMDEATWEFADTLVERLAAHSAVRFVSAAELFAP